MISIHALREEGDLDERRLRHVLVSFLSTPSARRATRVSRVRARERNYFYPRPPRGGRPEDDMLAFESFLFLSTPSARRATYDGNQGQPDL